MFFKEKKYKPCGFFSANLYQEYCLINYLIAPKFRKMGLSKFLLKLGLKKINNYKKDIKIFAKVPFCLTILQKYRFFSTFEQ